MSVVKPVFATALALAFSTTAPLMAAGQDAKRGAEVFAAQKCSVCHSIAGKGGRAVTRRHRRKDVGGDIRKWITNPVEMTAKSKSTKKPPMPAKWASLPAADVDALVAYMASLK
jgi:mono/diheme cytochrome c family protein